MTIPLLCAALSRDVRETGRSKTSVNRHEYRALIICDHRGVLVESCQTGSASIAYSQAIAAPSAAGCCSVEFDRRHEAVAGEQARRFPIAHDDRDRLRMLREVLKERDEIRPLVELRHVDGHRVGDLCGDARGARCTNRIVGEKSRHFALPVHDGEGRQPCTPEKGRRIGETIVGSQFQAARDEDVARDGILKQLERRHGIVGRRFRGKFAEPRHAIPPGRLCRAERFQGVPNQSFRILFRGAAGHAATCGNPQGLLL